MMNNSKKTKIKRLVSLGLTCAGLIFVGGSFTAANAQTTRDPFAQPEWAKPRNTNPNPNPGKVKGNSTNPNGPAPIAVVTAPPIEQRINYYKSIRESAAANGLELPKVTSVLTLDELAVTGIFKTPRGYAAMVEAKPIKLSYTIYPGEKFFDGQLVAIEENRLVFRKVTKMSNGKFISSVENKTLRQYTMQETVQGTAPTATPAASTSGTTETATTETPAVKQEEKPVTAEKAAVPTVIVSPVDEMNKQPTETDEAKKSDKKGKKTNKVAKNKKQ